MHRTTLARLRHLLVDIVYPKTCADCGSRGHWLCTYCAGLVAGFGDPRCDRCGAPADTARPCWCRRMGPHLDKVRSPFPYEGWVATAVHHVKYRGETDRIEHLVPFMMSAMTDMGSFDALVPVPLHASRFRERGYNQSEELADAIGLLCGIPVQNMVERSRHTLPQVTLSGAQRRKNMEDAFRMAPGWRPGAGERYLLIDDVRTSGATLNACAAVLTAAGATSVSALTFALDI